MFNRILNTFRCIYLCVNVEISHTLFILAIYIIYIVE